MRNLIKNNWLALAIVLFGFVFGLFNMNILPDQIPTHFNIEGKADQLGSKSTTLLFLPVLAMFVVLFVSGLLKVSPKLYSAEHSEKAISKMNAAIAAFLMLIHVIIIYEALGYKNLMAKVLPMGLSLLIMLLGNYFGKLEKNMVIGMRLPWTLASDENWKQTHRFTGKLYFISGITSLVVNLFYPQMITIVAAMIIANIAGSIYSYRFFVKNEKVKD